MHCLRKFSEAFDRVSVVELAVYGWRVVSALCVNLSVDMRFGKGERTRPEVATPFLGHE